MTTTRYVYIPKTKDVGVMLREIQFDWYPGFSILQKQKSIRSLHDNIRALGIQNILEVSSKSENELGVHLSAFNMFFTTKKFGRQISVESAFQGSKVFDRGGPLTDLYSKTPIEAKKDERLQNLGNIIGFRFFEYNFDTKPRTLFYDWLYINALSQNKKALEEIIKYEAFTDIEFNPAKSINCQAYSVALAVSLLKNGLFERALMSLDMFKKVMKEEYIKQDTNRKIQLKLI